MRLLIITLFLFSALGSHAQALTLSLEEAKAMALENNREATISQLEIDKAEHIVKETLATGLPQISAEGSFQNYLDIPTTVLPDFISPTVYQVLIDENLVPEGSGGTPGFVPAQFGTNYNVTGGASVSQLIFSGSYLIGLQAAKSYVEFSKVQKELTELDVLESVTQAYFTVILAEENTRVLSESLMTLENLLNETRAMYNEGFVEEQDVEQLQLTFNNLKSQESNALRQQDLTRQLLNFQLGLPLDQAITLTDDLSTLTDETMIGEELLEIIPDLNDHPSLKVMDTNILLSNLRLKEQKSRYLPTLRGFFNIQRQAQRNEFNFFDSGEDWFPVTVWGINLNVPIFSSGMMHQQVKQREVEVKEAEIRKDQVQASLEMNASKAKSDYIYALETYDLEQSNLDLALSIRNKNRIKYQEGISSSFELNEIENQYIKAQGKKIQASFNLLNALTDLKKAYNQL
jgi:outer membrane protein TolC